MVSEKYLAGFLDADGSIELICPSEHTRWFNPYVKLSWSQRADRSAVLEMIQQDYEAKSRVKVVKGKEYVEINIAGVAANMLLARIAKHLVVKRAYADVVLAFVLSNPKTVAEVQRGKKVVVAVRKSKSQTEPNYPTRKWLAGFFDGDGCLYADVKYGKSVSVRAIVTCAEYDIVSANLLKKAFGGSITNRDKRKSVAVWELYLDAPKAIKFLGHFSAYSIVKKPQVDFILGCAAMGHFHDGKIIAETLKTLKAHPHRLSDSAVDVRSLIAAVGNPPKLWSPKTGHAHCSECGGVNQRCATRTGLCGTCYARKRRHSQML